MPVKPLDLQVNINSLVEVSRLEGDRHARETDRQRHIDKQNIQDAIKQDQRVNQKEESAETGKLSDTEKHFGVKTVLEDEADFLEEQNRKRKKTSDKKQETQKKTKHEKKPLQQEEGHLDIMA
ncbi:MAG: hypothetical protein D6767_09680 [Candidatus Hydrogenedentota bacterium]|nr:MAG: hypothetical protein D6767_09680 [Candidatus Hydrogenedentota bacterium]